ncbi:LuxR C-terminal-related transcriptional regulator [Paenibacillus hodogayensis]|uniref:LuxR C-terminal-related transcriptional regulator n=1 Tax=Paenibacillus hodogayensis TaxID=279208 RepID=A0ABV5VY92_9BACL
MQSLRQWKDHFFIGREAELELLRQFADRSGQTERIVNIYGPGGIGKSFLLDALHRVLEKNGSSFILLGSRDFIHSPEAFARRFLSVLGSIRSDFDVADELEQMPIANWTDACLKKLNALAADNRIVLAIDTYEELSGLDLWLRQEFIARLPGNVLVIIAGRFPLRGEWAVSPGWRRMIRPLPLSEFPYETLCEYLGKIGILEEGMMQELWRFTRGHPFTLSLAASTIHAGSTKRMEGADRTEVLNGLVHLWLREVTDENLQKLLEAASMLRHFHQDLLGHVIEQEVQAVDFRRLTQLSFVRFTERGWVLHDLMRESIRQDLRARMPETYQRLSRRCVHYYDRKLRQNSTNQDISWERGEFFFHLGDSLIRAVFFPPLSVSSHHLETMDGHNVNEVVHYFQQRTAESRDKKVSFVDHETDRQYDLIVPASQDRKESDLLDPRSLLALCPDAVRLLRNEAGRLIGLVVMIPINEHTLDYLTTQPVSRAYFKGLTPSRKREFAVPRQTQSGWYIRMVDALDPEDASARRDLLSFVFSHILTGGILLASTPLPFYQTLLRRLGFEEVPKALHHDYGKDTPSPTFLIDLRGVRLQAYLDRMASSIGIKTDSERLAGLTVREKEIAVLLLGGKTNMEIASHLHLSEITVKKNLAHMFGKYGVKNRAQLMIKLYEGPDSRHGQIGRNMPMSPGHLIDTPDGGSTSAADTTRKHME